ncbi:MAG: hypothetical protein PHQ75_00680 [Thermoguttaceae bacterium]|nr:hypothetical protein [Thermoguttaceae bacterium]
MRLFVRIILMASVLVFCGCGPKVEQNRQKIEGSVSVNGVPLAQGDIEFMPLAGFVDKTFSGAPIKDGRYLIVPKKGLAPGEYLVRITGQEETGKMEDQNGMGPTPQMRDIVPPKYNRDSTLKVTVEGKKANQFDFDLKTK